MLVFRGVSDCNPAAVLRRWCLPLLATPCDTLRRCHHRFRGSTSGSTKLKSPEGRNEHGKCECVFHRCLYGKNWMDIGCHSFKQHTSKCLNTSLHTSGLTMWFTNLYDDTHPSNWVLDTCFTNSSKTLWTSHPSILKIWCQSPWRM